MADVITRFKLETTQFDSKLRDSAKSLSDLTHHLSIAGKDFERFAKEHVNTAKSFGEVASGATNLKDKLKDLVSAYNQVAKSYNVLSKDQQQTDFGKAMAESLQTLQQRIKDTKTELNSAPGFVDKLTERFTVNIDALKLFSIGLQAAEGALKVAKDAFFASEANVDEWGRTIASAQSVYEGFLTAINTGDVSGYLSRIDEIVKAARKAYDELDRLGTMKTIQSPQMDKQNAENTRLRTMLMTGRYIAPAAGSGLKASMADGTQLTPAQMKRLEQQLQNGMQTIVKLTGNELEQTGKAINAYYDKLAKQNGMTMEEFRKGTSSMAEFDKRLEMSRKYSEFETAHTTTITSTGSNGLPISVSRRDNAVNPYEQYKGWATFRVDKQGENSYNELVGLIRQQQQQTGQLYSTIGQAYRTINRTEGTTVRNLMNGGTGGSGSGGGSAGKAEVQVVTGSIDEQAKTVQELQKAWRAAADDDSRRRIKQEIDEAQYALDLMTGKEKFDPSKVVPIQDLTGRTPTADLSKAAEIKAPETIDIGFITPLKALEDQLKALTEAQAKFGGISEEVWQGYQTQIDEVSGKITRFKKAGVGGADATAESWRGAAQAMQAVGSALQQIEDPSMKIAGLVGQAIANIALGFAQATASDSKLGVFGWISAVAGGMATMLSTISAIHSATGYEQGGIVKGNSFSGDNIPIMANAGEVVLTRAMTNNLAGQLQGTAANIHMTASVKGEDIILSVNNTFKRKGKGELVTWRNR